MSKLQGPQKGPNRSPHHEGVAPPLIPGECGGVGGVFLRPQEDRRRPRKAGCGSAERARVAVGGELRCEGQVSVEVW